MTTAAYRCLADLNIMRSSETNILERDALDGVQVLQADATFITPTSQQIASAQFLDITYRWPHVGSLWWPVQKVNKHRYIGRCVLTSNTSLSCMPNSILLGLSEFRLLQSTMENSLPKSLSVSTIRPLLNEGAPSDSITSSVEIIHRHTMRRWRYSVLCFRLFASLVHLQTAWVVGPFANRLETPEILNLQANFF